MLRAIYHYLQKVVVMSFLLNFLSMLAFRDIHVDKWNFTYVNEKLYLRHLCYYLHFEPHFMLFADCYLTLQNFPPILSPWHLSVIVIILCLALFPWKDADDSLARKLSQFSQYEESLKNKIIRNVSAVFTVIVSGFLLSFISFIVFQD